STGRGRSDERALLAIGAGQRTKPRCSSVRESRMRNPSIPTRHGNFNSRMRGAGRGRGGGTNMTLYVVILKPRGDEHDVTTLIDAENRAAAIKNVFVALAK